MFEYVAADGDVENGIEIPVDQQNGLIFVFLVMDTFT